MPARRNAAVLLFGAVVILLSSSLWAHPLSFGSVRLEKTAQLVVGELVLDVPEAVLAQSADVRRRELAQQVRTGFVLALEESELRPEVNVVDLGQGEDAVDIVAVRFSLPASAQTLRVRTSQELGDVAVELVEKAARVNERAVVQAGSVSRQLWPSEPRPAAAAPSEAPSNEASLAPLKAAQPSRAELGDYLRLGFWHIVPQGIDHILFVLSLVLLVPRVGQLLLLLTLFTLGHAVSVALGVYGTAPLGESWVEPLIALSLAYAALEQRKPALEVVRPYVVGSFGLLHGLGFAAMLAQVGVPEVGRVLGLASFNVGVELGQLSVAFGPFALVTWLERRGPQERVEAVRRYGALAIATVGVGWALLRVLGL